MSNSYKPRTSEPLVRVTGNYSLSTVEGVNRLRQRFAARYPQRTYPSLSLALEIVVQRILNLWERDPKALDAALTDFARYTKIDKRNTENQQRRST